MSTHVLHDEVVVRGQGQVPSRVVPISGCGSRLDSSLAPCLIGGAWGSPRLTRVEHLGGSVRGARATLAHETRSAFRVNSACFVEKNLIIARCVRVGDG